MHIAQIDVSNISIDCYQRGRFPLGPWVRTQPFLGPVGPAPLFHSDVKLLLPAVISELRIHKNACGRGSDLNHAGGAYSTLQTLAGFGEGWEKEGEWKEGREGRKGGEGRDR